MFGESKYSNILTVLLVIVIVVIIFILVILDASDILRMRHAAEMIG